MTPPPHSARGSTTMDVRRPLPYAGGTVKTTVKSAMASYADMIAAHLNAPYGALVTTDDVLALLRQGAGSLQGRDRASASVLGALFDECSMTLIEHACQEAQMPLDAAAQAYASLIPLGAHRVRAWEARLTA